MLKNILSTNKFNEKDEGEKNEIGDRNKKSIFIGLFGLIRNHKNIFNFVILLLIFVIIGISLFYRRNVMKNTLNERVNTPLTTTLSKMDLTSSISVTGTIASADKRSVSASLTNTEIKEVHVSVGDYVNAGDTIITFDSSDLEKELETAENSLEINSLKDQKTLSDAAKAVEDAQNNYNNQAAGLQEDVNVALSNYNTLCAKRDSALSEYQTAQIEVQRAQNEYDTLKAQSETEGWTAKVADAKTALDTAQAEYDKAEVVSDIQLTSDLYDALQMAKTNYDNIVLQYENPLTVAQSKIDSAKQKESQALASYEEYCSQADAAYGAYYGKINTQTETNEKNAEQIEESKYNYQITALEQKNSKITENDQVQNVEEKLGEVVVTSPISGVITAVNVEAGEQYEGGTLFVVEDMEHFIVDASVDEYDIADICKDLEAVVKTDATDDDELQGVVSFVAPTPDSSADSGTNTTNLMSGSTSSSSGYEIQIILNDYDERIRIGMTAKTSIILESAEDVYAVAYDCIQTDGDGNTYIEIVDETFQNDIRMNTNGKENVNDNTNENNSENKKENTNEVNTTTKRLYIETGMESDYYTEIISDELYEGMKIVATASSGDNSSSKDFSNVMMLPGGDERMPGGGNISNGGGMSGNRGGGMSGGGF